MQTVRLLPISLDVRYELVCLCTVLVVYSPFSKVFFRTVSDVRKS